jgi:hypothetical protein
VLRFYFSLCNLHAISISQSLTVSLTLCRSLHHPRRPLGSFGLYPPDLLYPRVARFTLLYIVYIFLYLVRFLGLCPPDLRVLGSPVLIFYIVFILSVVVPTGSSCPRVARLFYLVSSLLVGTVVLHSRIPATGSFRSKFVVFTSLCYFRGPSSSLSLSCTKGDPLPSIAPFTPLTFSTFSNQI